MSFFCERTTSVLFPIRHRAVLFLLAASVIVGCGPNYAPPTVPESVATDLFVLGADHSLTAGIRVSELYRSFVSRLDQWVDVGDRSFSDRNREILEQLGLDPDTHDISFYASLDTDPREAVPAMILRAPLPPSILEKLAEKSNGFSRVDGTSDLNATIDSNVPWFSVSENSTAFFVARSSDVVLAASGSAEHLAQMLARSDEAAVDSPTGVFLMVGGADVWMVASDISLILDALSPDDWPSEIHQIISSIVAAGGSIELGEESVLLSLYLEPKDGIEARDIGDLVRGGIALLKMESEDDDLLIDFVERLRVSEYNGFSRVQIQISETDLKEWAETISRH